MILTIISDFTDDDGQVDWDAYRGRKIETGETCCRCGRGIIWPAGVRSDCPSCKALTLSAGRVGHRRFVRCPVCGEIDDIVEWMADGFGQEGEHRLVCSACECEYAVETEITETFYSPPLRQGREVPA